MDELAAPTKPKISPFILGGIVILVGGLLIFGITSGSTVAPSLGSVASSTGNISTDSSHATGYIDTFLSSLADLYQASQAYANAQQTFGSNAQDTVVLTSLDETINDMKDATSLLTPYINDQDEAISVSAKLLYADISIEFKDVTQMQASYTYAIDNESVPALQAFQNEIAAYGADKNTTDSDLLKDMQIVKYIIENPTNDPNPSGPIDYAISSSDRTYLVSQMGTLFPSPLDHAAGQSNVYLLYARLILLFLTADTYEQQSTVQV